jgi:hypothetical protein
MPPSESTPWWRDAVVYQVYPRSFQDSDGDGVGDLRGIAHRLDHLVDLGVDALWLSPIYPSPLADFGYDLTDHTAVDPTFGTLADLDRLVAEAHARGLRLLMDFVPCHTSIEHPWFGEHPDRYIWADGGGRTRWPTEQLAVRLRRAGLDLRRAPRTLVPVTRSTRSSRTSAGATRTSSRRCRRSSASGSTAASTASAWTRSSSLSRTRVERQDHAHIARLATQATDQPLQHAAPACAAEVELGILCREAGVRHGSTVPLGYRRRVPARAR